MCLYVIFQKFGHFLLKAIFVSLSQQFLTKKVLFCHFLKKSSFLVKFDIKNGFSDSFPFQKCILLYTLQYSLKVTALDMFQKILGSHLS